MRTDILSSFVFLAVLVMAGSAHAEKADRDKPTHIEADRLSVDDTNKINIAEGNVVLTKGTIQLRAERVEVRQDAEGFQTAVATNGATGLARFRQKREGRNEYVEGEAQRIEYDARNDKADLYGRAKVRSGGDEVRGEYVTYDGRTEQYAATGGSAQGTTKGIVSGSTAVASSRARAIIQPRSGAATTPARTR